MNERRFKHSPEEARKLWVEALRSGKFKQCKQRLCRLDGNGMPVCYCCLGVACQLFLDNEEEPLETHDIHGSRQFGGWDNVLPFAVKDWLGIDGGGGSYQGGDLWDDNDNQDKTFEEIAQIIESAPPGLFVEPQPAEAR